MNAPSATAKPCTLRVLIATQSADTGTAIVSLLGEPSDIAYQLVSLPDSLALRKAMADSDVVHLVVLDLEPWLSTTLQSVPFLKSRASPPLVVALGHSIGEPMRRQCRNAGVDYLFDRVGELEKLQNVMTNFALRLSEAP